MPESLTVFPPAFAYGAGLHAPVEPEIDRVRAAYEFEQPAEVAHFLNDHPELSSLLLDAISPLREAFGPDSPRKLRLLCDEECCSLHASVLWRGSLESGSDCLDTFDNAWWLDRSAAAGGNLVIDFEFVDG
jgi:hypothetical protein